jgi:uncharacterized protein HemX
VVAKANAVVVAVLVAVAVVLAVAAAQVVVAQHQQVVVVARVALLLAHLVQLSQAVSIARLNSSAMTKLPQWQRKHQRLKLQPRQPQRLRWLPKLLLRQPQRLQQLMHQPPIRLSCQNS